MREDCNNDFILATYSMPCCGTSHTLHELVYERPQGFGRFSLEAMNSNIGELPEQGPKELEDILSTDLRIIYRHM